jgi:acetoin utilization deacetylase AcuC-like enzyme
VSAARLGRVHDPFYSDSVWALAKSGGGNIEDETYVSPASYYVALLAAGSVCDAAERVARGEDRHALCLVRPPGHHALTDQAMGFCLFNNVAAGVMTALVELEIDRVLVVDWDVHHGNGTQWTFWEEPRVGFFSIHRWPFYPGTGAADDTGSGRGLGATRNVPIRFGTSRNEYLRAFRVALEEFASRIKPQLMFVSAGFDAHRLDPIGNLGLETEDYAVMTRVVLDVANVHAAGRVISVLEGGYHPAALADCVATHLQVIHQDEEAWCAAGSV